MKNRLYLIVGPSGVGKTTLVERILKEVPGTLQAVSTTTRKPRQGETDGISYNFVTERTFVDMIQQDDLLQYVIYNGFFYGLSKDEINSKLELANVLVIVEPKGADQLKTLYPDAISIYLRCEPEELVTRMTIRGDSQEDISSRMKTYDHFNKYMSKADYIINQGPPTYVIEDVCSIISRHRGEDLLKDFNKRLNA